MKVPHTTLRIPPKARARLDALAAADESNLTATMTKLINEAFRRSGLPEPVAPAIVPKKKRPH